MEGRLVGRMRERAVVRDRIQAGQAGRGSVVVFTGEAGIGKSTLLDWARAEAAGAGMLTFAGRAVPDDGVPEFWMWRRILAQAGLEPELLNLDADAGGTFDPVSAARFRAVDRTAAALAAKAAPAGALIALDDLQWADTASLRLLGHLGRDAGEHKLVIVAGLREGEPSAPPDGLVDLLASTGTEVYRLPAFARADIATYIGDAAGEEWVEYLHRHTAGNPLVLRELVRLVEHDWSRQPPERVPEGLTRLVSQRLAGVSSACAEVLGAASTVGDEVDVQLLRSVVDRPLDRELAEAVAAGILQDDPDGRHRLAFAHGLLRQACYDALSRTERVHWHRRVADALTDPEEVARHRIRAVADEPTADLARAAVRAAAQAATARRGFDDAAFWHGKESELTEGAERAAALVQLASARFSAARVTEALGHAQEAADLALRHDRPDLAAAAALVVRDIGGPLSVPVAALCERARAAVPADDVATLAKLLALQAAALTEMAADPGALTQQAMDLATASGDSEALMMAIQARFGIAYGPDDLTERIELAARMRQLGESSQRVQASLWAAIWRYDLALQRGLLGEADAEITVVEGLVERIGWPLARWHLLRMRAARALIVGQFALAERLATDALAVAQQTQDESAQYLHYSFMADVLGLLGRFRELEATAPFEFSEVPVPIARALFARHLATDGETDRARTLLDQLRPQLTDLALDGRYLVALANAGEAAAVVGDLDTVRLCDDRVRAYDAVLMYSSTGIMGSVARVLGLMAMALGRLDDAIDRLRDAVGREQRAGALPYVAICHADLATVLLARGGPGDRAQATTHAEHARHLASRLGMGPTESRGRQILQTVSGIAAGPGTLTAREREIASLVAEGLSNRAVAKRLVLSERTVETHVRSVLSKLGLTNRTQIAAWARRSGLEEMRT